MTGPEVPPHQVAAADQAAARARNRKAAAVKVFEHHRHKLVEHYLPWAMSHLAGGMSPAMAASIIATGLATMVHGGPAVRVGVGLDRGLVELQLMADFAATVVVELAQQQLKAAGGVDDCDGTPG